MKKLVVVADALEFVKSLKDGSVTLAVLDPPYYGIVSDAWDNQWKTVREYVRWLVRILRALRPKLTSDGSLLLFGGIGKHNERPLFEVMRKIERKNLYQYRNFITWAKRRGYGKSHDFVFAREELIWYSASAARTEVVFNIPLTTQLRGYDGFNKKYPAKSKFKRVTNCWSDIPELMRPERSCQKPIPLLDRIILTHSNPGDLVIDCFAGTGTAGVSAVQNARKFKGADTDRKAAAFANSRIKEVTNAQREPDRRRK